MTLSRIRQKLNQRGVVGLSSAILWKIALRLDAFAEAGYPRRPCQDNLPESTLESSAYNRFQVQAHRVLARYSSAINKNVLEVGGAQEAISASAFLNDGAATVTVTGLNHISLETDDQRLRIMRVNALDLSSHFEPCSMDIVYGLSIIEHIPEPKKFLEQIYKVLKPGGFAYLQGDPIWTSPKGHHLWVTSYGGRYGGKATGNYLFCDRPNTQSTNPLPDWGHLLMSENELTAYLEELLLPNVDIQCIIDWVFMSDQINRISFREIAEAYAGSNLIVLEANINRVDVPSDLLPRLRESCGEGIDFGIAGVSYVLAKPE